jgi:exodeoxyribonuclease VII large subunit
MVLNSPLAPLSVSDLTRMVKGALEAAFPPLWVEGEITGFRAAPSGHLYLSLKDDRCSVKVVMFKGRAMRLRFTPRDGMRVLVAATLTVYEARGDYQLLAEELEPRGAGAAALALAELKARLAAEGLFDEERKRQLPEYPRVVGVVTSPAGAAIHDIVQVFRQRGAHVSVVLAPALVQGEEAPAAIVAALELLGEWGGADLVICGRGGGSAEDLAAFNDERVVRAVGSCPVPVVSAVGHQIDSSLADLAADLSAPTPSAAAEMVAKSGEEVEGELVYLSERLAGAVVDQISDERRRLAALGARLVHPRAQIVQARLRTDELAFRLESATRALIADRRARAARLAAMLDSLSPLAVLGRGYAILRRQDGSVVRSPADVAEGEGLTARLAEGELKVRVEGK